MYFYIRTYKKQIIPTGPIWLLDNNDNWTVYINVLQPSFFCDWNQWCYGIQMKQLNAFLNKILHTGSLFKQFAVWSSSFLEIVIISQPFQIQHQLNNVSLKASSPLFRVVILVPEPLSSSDSTVNWMFLLTEIAHDSILRYGCHQHIYNYHLGSFIFSDFYYCTLFKKE